MQTGYAPVPSGCVCYPPTAHLMHTIDSTPSWARHTYTHYTRTHNCSLSAAESRKLSRRACVLPRVAAAARGRELTWPSALAFELPDGVQPTAKPPHVLRSVCSTSPVLTASTERGVGRIPAAPHPRSAATPQCRTAARRAAAPPPYPCGPERRTQASAASASHGDLALPPLGACGSTISKVLRVSAR